MPAPPPPSSLRPSILRPSILTGARRFACVVAGGCPAAVELPQSEACAHVVEFYFPADGGVLANLDGFETFPKQRDAMVRAYGPEGDCWHLDENVAAQCDSRCRDLLYEDCIAPFDDPADGTPVAPRACDFPPRCTANADCAASECLIVDRKQGCCATPDSITECGYPPAAP